MSIELSKNGALAVGRVRVTEEAAGSYGTDVTGSATYLDVPCQGIGTLTLNKPQVRTNVINQYRVASPATINGITSWSLTMDVTMGTLGNAADASTATLINTDSAQLLLLKALFGGVTGAVEGSLIDDAAPTTTEVDVTGTEGSQFSVGGACASETGAGSALEVREILSRATDTLTMSMAFSSAPADTSVLYNATTIFPTEDPDTSLQFIVEGAETDDAWLLQGGQCTSIACNLPTGDLATWSFTFEGPVWTPRASMASAPTFAAGTYSNHNELIAAGELLIQVHGTSTRNVIDAQTVSIAPTVSFVDQRSVSAAQTVARKRAVKTEDFCLFTMTLPFEDTTWFTARDNATLYAVQYQIGSAAGEAILFSLPRCQVHDVQVVGEGELASQTVTFRARHDDLLSSERGRAPLRIHFA